MADATCNQRHRLAAMAMQAIIFGFREVADAAMAAPWVAEDAFRLADAFIAEGAKGTP